MIDLLLLALLLLADCRPARVRVGRARVAPDRRLGELLGSHRQKFRPAP